MTDSNRAIAAARYLVAERSAGRTFTPVPDGARPRNVAEAFAAQSSFHTLMAPSLGRIVGYKVALTTRVMQQMVGFDEPIPGAIFESTVHPSGTTIRADGFNHLGIECELALRVGTTLSPDDAPFDREQVADAISEVMAAFELVDDRSVDYDRFADNILSFIADNAWNAGAVLGEGREDWRTMDLAAIEGTARRNGAEAGCGHGRDVMGHPLDALTWLANALAARGNPLPAGMLVMTGSIIATQFVAAGDDMTFQLGELPPVSVRIG